MEVHLPVLGSLMTAQGPCRVSMLAECGRFRLQNFKHVDLGSVHGTLPKVIELLYKGWTCEITGKRLSAATGTTLVVSHKSRGCILFCHRDAFKTSYLQALQIAEFGDAHNPYLTPRPDHACWSAIFAGSPTVALACGGAKQPCMTHLAFCRTYAVGPPILARTTLMMP